MRKTLIGDLIGNAIVGDQAGKGNPNAGAEPQLDDEGKIVSYKLPDGTIVKPEDVAKTGTSALAKPSMAMRLFAPEAASRVDAVNTQYAALPNEKKQEFAIEKDQVKDIVKRGYKNITGKDMPEDQADLMAASVGTKAKAAGFGPSDLADVISGREYVKAGGPEATGQTRAAQAKGQQQEETTFQNEGGYQAKGSAAATGYKSLGARAASELRLQPQQEATMGAELKEREGLAEGGVKRLPLTNAVLDQDMVNRLSKATNVDPKEIEYQANDLAARLGRQPTEMQLETELLKNRLFSTLNIERPEQTAAATMASKKAELAPLAANTMAAQTGQQNIMANQPPDTGRPILYKSNMDALMSGDLGHGYTRLKGFNPYYVSPLTKADAMMSAMGNGAPTKANLAKIQGGNLVVGGAPSPAAPITSGIQSTVAQPNTATTNSPISTFLKGMALPQNQPTNGITSPAGNLSIGDFLRQLMSRNATSNPDINEGY